MQWKWVVTTQGARAHLVRADSLHGIYAHTLCGSVALAVLSGPDVPKCERCTEAARRPVDKATPPASQR